MVRQKNFTILLHFRSRLDKYRTKTVPKQPDSVAALSVIEREFFLNLMTLLFSVSNIYKHCMLGYTTVDFFMFFSPCPTVHAF